MSTNSEVYKGIKEKMGKNLYFHYKNGNGEITYLNFYKRAMRGMKPYKNEDELREKSHIVISAHFTRRRRDTIRRRLAEEFHLQSYSNRDRGYYISSKFTLEHLIEVVEGNRKSSSGTFKKKISDTRNRVLAKLAKKPP